MAKTNEADPKSDQATPADAAAPSTEPARQAPQQQITLDESDAVTNYVNFCRVNGTPEELVIDFGLNPQPFGTPDKPLAVTQRLVMNYFTAKRLLGALHMAVQRHESAFGAVETNVQKRVLPQAAREAGA